MSALALRRLEVTFATPDGALPAVRGIDLEIAPGARLGVVGESGAGKSQAFLAVMGLLAANGRAAGEAWFEGANLLALDEAALNRFRGRRLAMVFQDPMTALNPYLRIGTQMSEVLTVYQGMSEAEARAAARRMLERVHMADARRRLDLYPHELSGGMRQRVLVAMAALAAPALLIADEPTTALDVTVQAEVLGLFRELVAGSAMSLVLITHDLGVVAGLCDRLAVMYAGRIVEAAPTARLLAAPRHPYSEALLAAVPSLESPAGALKAIPGQPPNPLRLPSGCAFRDRCPHVMARCAEEVPDLRAVAPGWEAACHLIEAAP